MRNAITFLFLLLFTTAFAQDENEVTATDTFTYANTESYVFPPQPYAAIDSSAKTVQFKDDIRLLSYDLTKNYSSQLDKARAIYTWITYNIAYDYKVLNKKRVKTNTFKCKNGDNCDVKYAKWEDDYLKKVIHKRKSVCQGYAMLFKKLCDHAGIQGDVIAGYTKNKPEQIGKPGNLNHVWNAMLINGTYYYLDATWGAGGCTKNRKGKYVKFRPQPEEYYWLTPANLLSRDHFPADSVWVKNMNYKKAKNIFRDNAYIAPSEIHRLELLSPDTGIVDLCVGDTLHFSFRYKNMILGKLQVNTNLSASQDPWVWSDGYRTIDEALLEDQKYIPFTYDPKSYSYIFSYVADNKKLRYIDVLIDYRRAIRIKISML